MNEPCESGKPTLEGMDMLRAIQESFFAHLDTLDLPQVRERETLPRRIREALSQRGSAVAHLVANDMDRGNVGFAVLAVAAYDVLLPETGAGEAMRIVDACLNTPLRAWVLDGTRKLLDDAPDPFAALVSASKEREAHTFGPSFVFERLVDDGFGYVLNIKRCLFHEALKVCGRTELQPLLCRFDLNWIDAIDPRRHHLRFARPSTFASAGLCRMWFMRLEHLGDNPLSSTPHATTHR
jgi:hypothetical protein